MPPSAAVVPSTRLDPGATAVAADLAAGGRAASEQAVELGRVGTMSLCARARAFYSPSASLPPWDLYSAITLLPKPAAMRTAGTMARALELRLDELLRACGWMGAAQPTASAQPPAASSASAASAASSAAAQ